MIPTEEVPKEKWSHSALNNDLGGNTVSFAFGQIPESLV
jgi:hypothetical protein